tara:strand:+ start:124 stop:660 length:537 start_codon:yes stop_codon:yes gene_type:complete
MKYKNWIALFSQTGSEIVNLSLHFGRAPDTIISNAPTDKMSQLIKIDYQINNEEAKSLDILNDLDFNIDETLITLNGWLRIVPPDKCNKYNIYNGHPGLITKYPELKGKDPQQRTWDNISNYPYMGSVIHKVVEEVDNGEVLVEKFIRTENIKNLNAVYTTLRNTSYDAWVEFLKEHL